MNSIIIRYSEIGLKGKNKGEFEGKLVRNIKHEFKKNNLSFERIERNFSRIIIRTKEKADLTNVFGISSYSYSVSLKPDIDLIEKEAEKLIHDFNKNTVFRVSAQRLDKTFPLKSVDIERRIGSFVVEKKECKVNLKKFEKDICIEVLPGEAFVFEEKIRGKGGLPVGIEGNVIVLIENKDSIKAATLIMKRGCEIIPVGFNETDLSKLEKYSQRNLEMTIIKDLKEVDAIAEKHDAKALVVSQTLKTFKDINTNLLVLRPLISKQEE